VEAFYGSGWGMGFVVDVEPFLDDYQSWKLLVIFKIMTLIDFAPPTSFWWNFCTRAQYFLVILTLSR
jgi:hypothetical protein